MTRLERNANIAAVVIPFLGLIVGATLLWHRFLDWRDLAMLFLTFPELKTEEGAVAERLRANGASKEVMATWKELVAQEILPEDEDAGF